MYKHICAYTYKAFIGIETREICWCPPGRQKIEVYPVSDFACHSMGGEVFIWGEPMLRRPERSNPNGQHSSHGQDSFTMIQRFYRVLMKGLLGFM